MKEIPGADPLHELLLYAFGLLLLLPPSFFFTAAKFLLLLAPGDVDPCTQLPGSTFEINRVTQPDIINQVATFRTATEAEEPAVTMHMEGCLRLAGMKGTS